MKVVLIEDNAEVRRVFRISLEWSGFSVHEHADCGDVCPSLLDDAAVVVVDVCLPSGGGDQWVAQRRREGYEGAVILMSTLDERELARRAGDCGADAYFVKGSPLAVLSALCGRMDGRLRAARTRGGNPPARRASAAGGRS